MQVKLKLRRRVCGCVELKIIHALCMHVNICQCKYVFVVFCFYTHKFRNIFETDCVVSLFTGIVLMIMNARYVHMCKSK